MITFSWKQAAVFIAIGLVLCILVFKGNLTNKVIGWADKAVERITR